jgi:hypothetical protein
MRLFAISLVAVGFTAFPLSAQSPDATTPPVEATADDGGASLAAEAVSEEPAPIDDGTSSEPSDVEAPARDSADVSPPVDETVDPIAVDETVVEVQEQEASSGIGIDLDEPSVLERQIVAFVASGVSVTSLAVGVAVGILAWQQFNCLQNVLTCNETLAEPIYGADYFTARSNVEHLALIADMAYLFAGAAAIVAVTAFVRGFIFTGETEEAEGEQATSTSSRLGKPAGLARAYSNALDARGAE